MSSRSRSPSPHLDTVPLLVRHVTTTDLRSAASELRNLDWLGVPQADSAGPTRPITTELELPVIDGSSRGSPIRKSVIMEVGRPRVDEDAVAVDISWRSATLAPLFPVFVGRLVTTSKDVTLGASTYSVTTDSDEQHGHPPSTAPTTASAASQHGPSRTASARRGRPRCPSSAASLASRA